MRLAEFVFQGPFGCRTPVRIKAEEVVEEFSLPPGMKTEDFHDLLTAVLYPTHTTSRLRHQMSQNDKVKIAAVFTTENRKYRITRRSSVESLRIQAERDGSYVDLAKGRKGVESFLVTKLGLPDFETFWTLNLWRFDSSPKGVSGLDADLLDHKIRDIVMRYRLSLKAESLEDRSKALESEIKDIRKKLGKGIKLEDQLNKAKARLKEVEVTQLSEEDLELLGDRDAILSQLHQQIDRLESEKEDANYQLDRILPASPTSNPGFWGALALGLVSLVAAFFLPDYRPLALIDILAFGACVWFWFRYYSEMERASVHLIRLGSIKRRLSQVKEEHTETREKLNHIMVHADARDSKELIERVSLSERLHVAISQMKAKVESLRNDPEYLKASGILIESEKRMREIKEQRANLPSEIMSSYQLETDLQSMGIDPAAVREENDSEISEVEEVKTTPFERILEAARQTSQFDGIELHARTQKMWLKISAHILGERFGAVSVKNSNLMIGSLGVDQMKMWKRTRPSEYQVVLSALALSVQVIGEGLSKRGAFSSLIIADFSKSLTGSQPKKLQSVFRSAGQKTNVVICRSV